MIRCVCGERSDLIQRVAHPGAAQSRGSPGCLRTNRPHRTGAGMHTIVVVSTGPIVYKIVRTEDFSPGRILPHQAAKLRIHAGSAGYTGHPPRGIAVLDGSTVMPYQTTAVGAGGGENGHPPRGIAVSDRFSIDPYQTTAISGGGGGNPPPSPVA